MEAALSSRASFASNLIQKPSSVAGMVINILRNISVSSISRFGAENDEIPPSDQETRLIVGQLN
jgi:hypothetical protein